MCKCRSSVLALSLKSWMGRNRRPQCTVDSPLACMWEGQASSAHFPYLGSGDNTVNKACTGLCGTDMNSYMWGPEKVEGAALRRQRQEEIVFSLFMMP